MTALLAADPVTGLANMLGQPFVRHALLAGTAIALLSGLVGYFVVLRGQVFAGDALSHVAYAGALAALAAGLDLRLGLFAATVGVGVLLGLLGGRGVGDDVLIGTAFAWVLGLGVLFLSIYTSAGSNGDATANVNVLFGSIFSLDGGAAATASWVAASLAALLLLIARPLLFASIDPAVAAARGVPVRLLGPLFLAIVGGTVGEASQAVGALLVFGLLAAPAAAARRLTADPWRALGLAAALAVLAVWAGLVLAYAVPALPPSFTIVTLAAAEFAVAAGYSVLRGAPGTADGATAGGPEPNANLASGLHGPPS